MHDFNIFNRRGYLTNEERKKPLVHDCEWVRFESNIDLSEPIKVYLISGAKGEKLPLVRYSRDLVTFTWWWTYNILQDLNGFSGFDNLKFELIDFDVDNNKS